MSNIPGLKKGDKILFGKYKNREATITGFGTDDNNQPTIITDKGEIPVFHFRLQNLMENKTADNVLSLLLESRDLHSVLSSLTSGVKKGMVSELEDNMVNVAKISLKRIKSEKLTDVSALRRKGELPGLELIDLGSIPMTNLCDPDKADLKHDHENLASKFANKAIDKILSDFTAKVVSKLSKIGDDIGSPNIDLLSHYSHQGQLSAELKFIFKKAEFRVKTQIVSVWNNNGTAFIRYPLTFHDVVLSDGSKMKSPSEKKMATEFK